MYRLKPNKLVNVLTLFIVLVVTLAWLYIPDVKAATILQNRSDQISNSGTGAVATHLFSFTYTNTSTPVGSVSFTYCSNNPIISDPCTYPTGLDLSHITLAGQTGETGFTLLSDSGGEIIITRNPSNPVSLSSSYKFNNVVNPSSPGSYYVRIETYSSIDASGPQIEQGGTVFAILSAFTVNSIVPPYLTFCEGVTIVGQNCSDVSGDLINFGDFSTSSTSSGTSQFVVATNAQNGYSVTADGPTLTSGNNTIPSLASPTSSQHGSSQFGMNLVANSDPVVGNNPTGLGTAQPTANYRTPNLYTYNDDDVIASASAPSNFLEFTVSYIVNINSSQPEGVYATTINYICLANF